MALWRTLDYTNLPLGHRGSDLPPAGHSLPLPFESHLRKAKQTPIGVCFVFGGRESNISEHFSKSVKESVFAPFLKLK